ncbi:MAG: hypothetical protein AAF394_01015 [Planctomycetota bacterium]
MCDATKWSAEELCYFGFGAPIEAVASVAYRRTCRTYFEEPGFCLIDLGADASSTGIRRTMLKLSAAMSQLHQEQTGKKLVYLSAARFDQQESTRPHLDGGPEECFLMLGYEPSLVASEFEISDYSRCAHEMGITPAEFLQQHNPMFQNGRDILDGYTTRIPCFNEEHYQILCVNNSSSSYGTSQDSNPGWQGVLHTATISDPDEDCRRIINSTMIAPVSMEASGKLSDAELEQFATTTAVKRRGYDKLHLKDDV